MNVPFGHRAHDLAAIAPQQQPKGYLMNHLRELWADWGAEQSFGASVVIAIFALIAMSFWPGSVSIRAWLALPLAGALTGWS